MPSFQNRHGQVIHAEGDLARVLRARGYVEVKPTLEVSVEPRAVLSVEEEELVDQVIRDESPPARFARGGLVQGPGTYGPIVTDSSYVVGPRLDTQAAREALDNLNKDD